MPTPEEWLTTLDKRLEERRKLVDLCERYYNGEHRMEFATTKFREAFGNQLKTLADNWCRLVVDASVERLAVEGFRFGRDEGADDEAWDIWQANEMDAQSMLAFTEAVKAGESYLLTAPGPDGEPIITVEHPSQCIVAHAAGMRRRRTAALKKWLDEDGYIRANVYLPEVVVKFRSEQKHRTDSPSKVQWKRYDDGLGEAEQEHAMGAVPMVALINEPSMLHGGTSDLVGVIPQQDAVNKLVADMVVASEFAAYPQRYAIGVEDDPDDDGRAQELKAAVSRLWKFHGVGGQLGQFQAADLSNYTKAIEMLVQHIAAQTRTPPHYLLGQSGAFPSGESLKSTETGLVAKVRRKQLTFGEGCEESMRLAFRVRGDTDRGEEMRAETLWRDPESRTTAEQTDAAIKEIAAGVPRELVWTRRLGMSPQELARARVMAAGEALSGLLAPPGIETTTSSAVPGI